MKLSDLELLSAVARRGSFAKAAEEHLLDPSSVSRAVAELEEKLGFRIFQRTTRRLAPTEAGEQYLARIEPLLSEFAQALDAALSVSGSPKGTLRITASVTFGQTCIVPLLSKFRVLYPDLKLDCIFSDANLDLVSERIDLAVRMAPSIEGNVIASKLMDTRYRLVASRAYLRKHSVIEVPIDLKNHRLLLFSIRDFRTNWLFRDQRGKITEVLVDGDITLSPAIAVRNATLDGLGAALLPSWLVDGDIEAKRLVNLFPDHDVTATTFERACWLIYPSRSYLPNKVRVMIDFLRRELC